MLQEASQEPVLVRGAAEVFLRMSGRAHEEDGRLVPADPNLDSIGKGAFHVYETGRANVLSMAIAEATGRFSEIEPKVLGEIVMPAVTEHTLRLAQPSAEAEAAA